MSMKRRKRRLWDDDEKRRIVAQTRVTWLKLTGISSFKVGKFVGLSEAMVERRYGHHDPEYLEDVAQAMGG